MKKTLTAHFIDGTVKPITAEKVDYIIDGEKNVYTDNQGNYFRVQKLKFHGMQFYQLRVWDAETKSI